MDVLDAGRYRLTYRLAIEHARSNALDVNVVAGGDGTLVVDRLAESVDHPADHAFAGGHGHDLPRALHLVTLFDLGVFAHDHYADLVFFQVHGDSGNAVPEVEQLAGHDFVQAVHAGDAVTDRDDRAHFIHRNFGLVVLDLLANELRDFICFDLSHIYLKF